MITVERTHRFTTSDFGNNDLATAWRRATGMKSARQLQEAAKLRDQQYQKAEAAPKELIAQAPQHTSSGNGQ